MKVFFVKPYKKNDFGNKIIGFYVIELQNHRISLNKMFFVCGKAVNLKKKGSGNKNTDVLGFLVFLDFCDLSG